jgi:predicted dehydrogenase
MSKIRIGVIGAGLIGRRHIATIAASDECEVAGLVEPNPAALPAEFRCLTHYPGHVELLRLARPDAVVIATPNQTHAAIGIDCARHGVHMLIEKPVADTVAAAAALVAEVKRAGVRTLVGHHRRHAEPVRRAKAIVESGRIGTLVGVSGIWATHKPQPYFGAAEWRSREGGGPILINLIHELDFLRFVCGEIASISGLSSNRIRGFAVEDTAGAVLGFAGGAIGTVVVSDTAVSPWTVEQGLGENAAFPFSGQNGYRFLGTLASLEFPNLTLWSQPGGAQDWEKPIAADVIPAERIDLYAAQLRHFCHVVRGEEPSIVPAEDGARTLAVTLALGEASRLGRRVDLPA